MQLGSFNRSKNHYDAFRQLSTEELDLHKKYTPCILEARDRLALFRMLDQNYGEWKSYLQSLLSVSFNQENDVSENLNRLLLNYLTFAYTIQEHFNVSFQQRYKKQPIFINQYKEFINRLCEKCWPFAFLQDYRGYVQHVGLGITRYNRNINDFSVTIEIVADAKSLLKGSRQWAKSNLTQEKGDLDLIAILKEFHIQMIQSYAVFVAKTFFPDLSPASEFYARLTQEVHDRDKNARMVFYSENPEIVQEDDGKQSVSISFTCPPNDVFSELGIKIQRA
jgi:hypothetical protein